MLHPLRGPFFEPGQKIKSAANTHGDFHRGELVKVFGDPEFLDWRAIGHKEDFGPCFRDEALDAGKIIFARRTGKRSYDGNARMSDFQNFFCFFGHAGVRAEEKDFCFVFTRNGADGFHEVSAGDAPRKDFSAIGRKECKARETEKGFQKAHKRTGAFRDFLKC